MLIGKDVLFFFVVSRIGGETTLALRPLKLTLRPFDRKTYSFKLFKPRKGRKKCNIHTNSVVVSPLELL